MKKELVSNEVTVLEQHNNKALVSFTCEKEQLTKVVKLNKNVNKGESVTVYKVSRFNLFWQILYAILPLIMLVAGFGLGFLFKNDLYHYILGAGCGVLGFVVSLSARFIVAKYKPFKYIAE